LQHWPDTVANPRVHATTQRVINEAFAEEKPHLNTLPLLPFRSVLKLERRVSVGGNLYSVPDATRKRIVEVHTLADEVRILEDGILIASHPVLEGPPSAPSRARPSQDGTDRKARSRQTSSDPAHR
jgi:hypothetical protein